MNSIPDPPEQLRRPIVSRNWTQASLRDLALRLTGETPIGEATLVVDGDGRSTFEVLRVPDGWVVALTGQNLEATSPHPPPDWVSALRRLLGETSR